MQFVFEIAGDKQVSRRLLRVASYAGDARPVFSSIADLMMRQTDAQFASEGGHASGGWRPLKPATLDTKRRQGLDLRVLHATLALRTSLTVRGDANQLLRIRRDELAWGSTLPYSGAHQNPRPGSTLPQRRPVEFTEAARREILKRIQRYVLTGEVA